MRATIVIDANKQAAANRAAGGVDTQSEGTFTVPLADPSDPTATVAYWCSWDLDATGHAPQALWDAFDAEQVSPKARPTTSPSRSRPINVFDAAQYTPDEVLDALRLVRLQADTV